MSFATDVVGKTERLAAITLSMDRFQIPRFPGLLQFFDNIGKECVWTSN